MLIRREKPRYALISSAQIFHSGTGPSPLCKAVRQAAAYLLVSITMWLISWEVKKDKNISVGLAEIGTVGPVSVVNGSTLMLVRLLDHSSSSSSGFWSLLAGW